MRCHKPFRRQIGVDLAQHASDLAAALGKTFRGKKVVEKQ